MKKLSSRYFHSRPFLFSISLGISVLLWFFVTSGRDRGISRNLETSLELHNVPANLVIVGAPKTVEVLIAGSATQLSRLSLESVHAFVNLHNLSPGDYTLPVRAELPPTFELKEIRPSEVPLRLVSMESHGVSPQVRVRGSFSEGVTLVEAETEPREITLTAPKEVFESLSGVVAGVRAWELEESEGDVLYPVLLEAEGDFSSPSELVRLEPSEVEVRFRLSRKIETKLVEVSPVLSGEISRDHRIVAVSVSPEKVLLTGKPGSLEGILSLDTESFDISGIAGDVSQSVRVIPPPGGDIRMEPREVAVSLKVLPEMKEKTLRNVPLLVRGKSIYPQWEVFPSRITVHLQGSAANLREITSESLEAFVEVTNLVSRKISVPIRISLGTKGVTVLGTIPETATVYAKIDD